MEVDRSSKFVKSNLQAPIEEARFVNRAGADGVPEKVKGDWFMFIDDSKEEEVVREVPALLWVSDEETLRWPECVLLCEGVAEEGGGNGVWCNCLVVTQDDMVEVVVVCGINGSRWNYTNTAVVPADVLRPKKYECETHL